MTNPMVGSNYNPIVSKGLKTIFPQSFLLDGIPCTTGPVGENAILQLFPASSAAFSFFLSSSSCLRRSASSCFIFILFLLSSASFSCAIRFAFNISSRFCSFSLAARSFAVFSSSSFWLIAELRRLRLDAVFYRRLQTSVQNLTPKYFFQKTSFISF